MSKSADVALTTIKSICIVACVIGNSLVCAVIKRNRQMRYMNRYENQKSLFKRHCRSLASPIQVLIVLYLNILLRFLGKCLLDCQLVGRVGKNTVKVCRKIPDRTPVTLTCFTSRAGSSKPNICVHLKMGDKIYVMETLCYG